MLDNLYCFTFLGQYDHCGPPPFQKLSIRGSFSGFRLLFWVFNSPWTQGLERPQKFTPTVVIHERGISVQHVSRLDNFKDLLTHEISCFCHITEKWFLNFELSLDQEAGQDPTMKLARELFWFSLQWQNQVFLNLNPSSDKTSFLTPFYGLYFSHLYTLLSSSIV